MYSLLKAKRDDNVRLRDNYDSHKRLQNKKSKEKKNHLKLLKMYNLLQTETSTCQNMITMETSRSDNNDVSPSSCHKMSSKVSKFDSFCKNFKLKMVKVSRHLLPAPPFPLPLSPHPRPSALNKVKTHF